MTARPMTAAEHLRAAQAVLDGKALLVLDDIVRVSDAIERALDAIQLSRATAVAALDGL